MARPDFRHSVIARLVLGYGLLVGASIIMMSVVFYFGTIGVLQNSIDSRIANIASREWQVYSTRPQHDLVMEINRQLSDSFNSDTEIYALVNARNQIVAGNLQVWPTLPVNRLVTAQVTRNGRRVQARLLNRILPDGSQLVVGWELSEPVRIRSLVGHALLIAAFLSVVVMFAGAVLFRHQIETRIGQIRRTAQEIEAGDLTQRITVSSHDEFGRLGIDINRMLDRIEQLMDGVRHVSNAIAHDLRTPLSRIRNRLATSLSESPTCAVMEQASREAIDDIDNLIQVFDRLLQIAEAESGMHAQAFERVDLNQIAIDMTELYDASAEAAGMSIVLTSQQALMVHGDRNLLGNALASLLDNAIKYAESGGRIVVSTRMEAESVFLDVLDHGPGIPPDDLERVTTRFYRVDRSRHLPGNGLGLSIVTAIAAMHGGALELHNTESGLLARIRLPVI